jgi:hypothetical protein
MVAGVCVRDTALHLKVMVAVPLASVLPTVAFVGTVTVDGKLRVADEAVQLVAMAFGAQPIATMASKHHAKS